MVLYRVIWFLAGLLLGGVAVQYKNRKEFFREKKRKYHMSLLENSITDLNRKDLMPYFTDHGYKSIIVYGMGYYFRSFMDMIDIDQLNVYYADKNADPDNNIYSPLQIANINADVIVITAITYFDEIHKELTEKHFEKREIVSFQDIVFYVSKENV